MKHILFISHARGVHGAEAVMVQAAKTCAAHGARVMLVVPSIVPEAGLEEAVKGINGLQIIALPYRAGGINALRTKLVQLYNIPTLLRLKRFVKREQVEAIYSNTTLTILGAALAKATGVRHVWHWHEPIDERFGWHSTLKELYREWAQQADAIVCISRQQQKEWEQALDVQLKNAHVIYNPMKRIIPMKSDKHASRRGARIGFIGHFEKRKNIELLIRVFEDLHEQDPETSLLLCGAIDEKGRQYVENLTDLRPPVVTILPQTPDVAKFYNNIDILVLPSWRETMPLVVLEAMQAGVCVLQTNRSGMSELIEDGKESIFFSPDDAETLLMQLTQCLDAAYRQQIAKAGQEKALQLVNNLSFDKQIQDLLCK